MRLLLAVAEQAVLAGVRIDAAHRDPRRGDAGAHQRVVSAPDRSLDQAGLDSRDRVDQADMRGDVDDPQVGRRQHHRDFRCAGQRGQQFGVAGIAMAGGVQRFLVQRRGADGVDVAGIRQRDARSR